jgi:hypothetical protein
MTVFDKKDFPKVLAQVEQGSIAPTHRDSRSRIPAEH